MPVRPLPACACAGAARTALEANTTIDAIRQSRMADTSAPLFAPPLSRAILDLGPIVRCAPRSRIDAMVPGSRRAAIALSAVVLAVPEAVLAAPGGEASASPPIRSEPLLDEADRPDA